MLCRRRALRACLENMDRYAALGVNVGFLGDRNRNIELDDKNGGTGIMIAIRDVAAAFRTLRNLRGYVMAHPFGVSHAAYNLAQSIRNKLS